MVLMGIRCIETPTLPPFHPSRVLSQKFYTWNPIEEDYWAIDRGGYLHIYQNSEDNFRRQIRHRFPSTMYVWYCNDTARTGQGSLMVYVYTERNQEYWYASMIAKDDWQISQVKGTAKEILAEFEATNAHLLF